LECRAYHSSQGPSDSVHCNHTIIGAGQPCSGPVMTNKNHHCAQIQGTCSGAAQLQYPNEESCRQAFATYVDSPVAATNNNDAGSRQYHANAAQASSPQDLAHCQHAGPTGGNLVGQGKTYDTWKLLAGVAACQTMYPGLKAATNLAFTNWNMSDLMAVVPAASASSLTTYTAGPSPSHATGNTEVCRIYHITVAASSAANAYHCAHGDPVAGGQCGGLVNNGCE